MNTEQFHRIRLLNIYDIFYIHFIQNFEGKKVTNSNLPNVLKVKNTLVRFGDKKQTLEIERVDFRYFFLRFFIL